MSTRALRIWRGDATGGGFVDYEIDAQPGMVVLDAVLEIQRSQAKDLAVRWNCKAAKCGSCSAEVNGKPRLMCKTRLDALPEDEPITVQPMRAFPSIRDLVTDVSWNYEVNKKIPPFTPKPDAEWLIGQEDVDRHGRVPEVHRVLPLPGRLPRPPRPPAPAAVLRPALHGPDREPGDAPARRARPHASWSRAAGGIGLCNITKCCGDVCPEGITITDNAIIPLKERVVDRRYDPLLEARAVGSRGRQRT